MTELTGKVAVIVGAATGIGAGIARALAARGAIVEIGDIDEQGARDLADALDARATRVDVTDAAILQAFADDVHARHGRVDYLFSNAGAIALKSFAETTADDWRWLFDINLFGCVETVRAFLPRMIAQPKPSRVVVTSSVNALRTPAIGGQTVYMATKAAQAAFCRGLENELKDTGVGVSVIYPGSVATRIKEKSAEHRPDAIRVAIPEGAHGKATLTPEAAGELIVRQAARGCRYIITHPGERDKIVAAQAAILESIDALKGDGA